MKAVILSARLFGGAKDLAHARKLSAAVARSFASLRMTKKGEPHAR